MKNINGGGHPLHYTNNYYEYAYRAIQLICDNKKQEDIDTLCDEYSKLARKQYKEIILNETNLSRKLKKAQTDITKLDIYCNTFADIINNEDVISHIKNMCEKNNIKKCAFWGDFLISEVLAGLLKRCDVELEYIICNWNHGTCDTVIPVTEEIYPDTDALIICDVLSIDKRVKYCSAKTNSPIYSVFEFLPSK